MARVTVEDSLKNVENRFELILLASKRANDLMNNVEAKLDWDNDKPTVVALREIASGAIDIDYLRKAPATEAAEAGQAFGVTEREEGTGDRGNVEEDPDVALIAALYAAGNQNGNGDTNKEPD